MQIITVNDKKTTARFHDVIRELYKGDTHQTIPLDVEIENIFNPKSNKNFEDGDACRWIVIDNSGKLLGRVAAFYNRKKALKEDQPTGGIGFFECINNREAAFLLFDTARNWLQQHGMEAMDGPINFGENFVHWGLLVKGFEHQGYGMPYNQPYYKELFEEYGFQTYFEMYSYHKKLSEGFPDRIYKFAKHLIQNGGFTFEHFTYANKEKYLKDLCEVYNEVWKFYHEDYTPLQYNDMLAMLNDAKPVINEEFIWFVYENKKPIAMVIVFPDVNQIIKPFKGKLNIINMVRFLLHKKFGKVTRARQLLTGVVPEHQKTGVITAMFVMMVEAIQRNGIKELELSWTGDYNETVLKIYRTMGAQHAKTHLTMRYLFDRTKPFTRFTNEHSEKAQQQKIHKKEE